MMPIAGVITSLTFEIASAVFTGTVDFSTTIFEDLDTLAIMRAALSQYVKSAALPDPTLDQAKLAEECEQEVALMQLQKPGNSVTADQCTYSQIS